MLVTCFACFKLGGNGFKDITSLGVFLCRHHVENRFKFIMKGFDIVTFFAPFLRPATLGDFKREKDAYKN